MRQIETAREAARILFFLQADVCNDERIMHRWDCIYYIDPEQHIKESDEGA